MSKFSKLALLILSVTTNVLTLHWPIIFNIIISSCACELRTDLVFLWINVSLMIQKINGKLDICPLISLCDIVSISSDTAKYRSVWRHIVMLNNNKHNKVCLEIKRKMSKLPIKISILNIRFVYIVVSKFDLKICGRINYKFGILYAAIPFFSAFISP